MKNNFTLPYGSFKTVFKKLCIHLDEGRRRAEEALVKFPLRKTGSEPVLSAGKATSGASGPKEGGAATGGARPKYPRRAYSVKQKHLSGRKNVLLPHIEVS